VLFCWGHGDEGQLGDPALVQRNAPRQVGMDTDWIDVAAGDHFTCAIKGDGTRWCFGANNFGQLGNTRAWHETFEVVP
jgi:alpha-tubulin suppressor-like RCC1 family protein